MNDLRVGKLIVYFLLRRNTHEYLLHKRQNTGYSDGMFAIPAGHVDAGEPVLTAAIREAKEELGVVLEPNDLKLVHVMDVGSDGSPRMVFVFAADRWQGEPTNCEPDFCSEMGWYSSTALPELLVDRSRTIIEAFETGRVYSEYGWTV